MIKKSFILKVNCLDEKGLVARIAMPLYELGCFITSLDQYSDPDTCRFFMRLAFTAKQTEKTLRERLKQVFKEFNGAFDLLDGEKKTKLVALCSKPDHCLIDLLAKTKRGFLPIKIVCVASNHEDHRKLVEWYGYPFYYFPVMKENKQAQEKQIAELYSHYRADYIALARYMQILSPEFCAQFNGKLINIHHSFLPSFKGANPYKQAHDKGVKIIGATAHFVTPDLDEGPIIIQETIRVDHNHTVADLARYGEDVECAAFSRALKYVAEHRVFVNDHKTVVLK